ncbi:hypothetical protein KIL84_009663 [Mauremys mutica]|uniref:Uncharacterized protein n=1 Tax=Mauremys mutica TaxID=74926 RepID=A0A9D3XJV8_9SAUR|nr:hypothetical protein KIL84_009663 [Mauremys mutica]
MVVHRSAGGKSQGSPRASHSALETQWVVPLCVYPLGWELSPKHVPALQKGQSGLGENQGRSLQLSVSRCAWLWASLRDTGVNAGFVPISSDVAVIFRVALHGASTLNRKRRGGAVLSSEIPRPGTIAS